MSTQRIEQTVQEYTYKRPGKSREDVEFSLDPETSKSRRDDGFDSRDSLRERVLCLLEKVDGESGRGLSFADVIARHEEAQKRWNREVGDDLAELGVDVTTPFRLLYDPAGVVTVAGPHPDKEMIDAYFTANPGRGDELGDILGMGKLASAARAGLSRSEQTRPVSAEAMAAWYADNLSPGALSGGGGLLFGPNGSVYRGLDIRV